MNPQPRYKKGDRIGNRYQVHQALMGGMGEVYLCLDLEQMYPCALKTFQQRHLQRTKHLRRAFETEVATWVALEKHANIVRCFLMDILDSQPFMVLEWVVGEEGRGADLRGWLRQGPLDLKQALDFAVDICYGLVHVQQKQPGIVHRDLKPENILVAQGGLAKITDFGLAQIVMQADLEIVGLVIHEGVTTAHPQQSLAAQGGIAGTPPYMPPEQWQPGAVLDERADIYALGCILVEMLTGRPPFAVEVRPTTPETYQRWLSAWQWQHESADRSVFPSAIPAPLADLLTSCLAQDQAARPQSATDLLTKLQQVYGQLLGHSPRPMPMPDEFSFVDYNNRGLMYDTLGRYEEALAEYDQAIRLNPAYAIAFYNRGNTYATLGRYGEALADYVQVIRLNPDLTAAYINRGLTYKHLGRYEEALADYAQAIRLNPADATTYNNRGLTYKHLGRYEEALADFAHSIRLNPAYANAYNNRGSTYQQMGRYEEALADYAQAIRLNPDLANAYFNRGITYATLGRYEEALADYVQVIRLNPADADAYFNCGALLANTGRLNESLPYFEKAAHLGFSQAAQAIAQVRQVLGEASR